MPRPPVRRNRKVQQAPLAASTENTEKPTETSDLSEPKADPIAEGRSRQTRATTPQQQQLPVRSVKTPTQNNPHDHAIASSPEGRSETGSRPATTTRARGYSSTMSLVGRKGDFSSRIGSTPGFEGSIMSNFRRRPRQPSLLQMMQADNSSDLDDDDFLGGLSPQDESTPLKTATKPSHPNIRIEVVMPPLRTSVLFSSGSSDSRKRKRPSLPLDENGNPRPSEAASVPSSPLSNPPSNLPSSLPPSPMRTPRARPAMDPLRVSATPMSTPGSIQLSHDEQSKKAGESLHLSLMKGSVPKIATSTLQSKFLPRRRLRRRQCVADGGYEEEDLESFPGDSDDDELTRVVSQRSQDNSLSDITSQYANGKTRRTRQAAGSHRKSDKRPKGTSSRNASSPQKKKRTYSRLVDKENASEWSSELSSPPPSEDLETDPDTPVRNSGQRISSRELELQALKFAEVDKWQMEFEDVSNDWT
ncbi:hypothetical protein PISL3812_07470 [Talaromyces islandicus]|uniref:Uncharacterized protein n=1 Tax=Talaromyces islandicus TaxID=28573 RepID=A0A0U1M656_TALIS|nr:hypothetical protein PISL3812_07470 [Talaromyces islandicus]